MVRSACAAIYEVAVSARPVSDRAAGGGPHSLVPPPWGRRYPACPQRGQFWLRRFRQQAERLCAALVALAPPPPALQFVSRELHMLQSVGWITAHRFLFGDLLFHVLGWQACLAPDG